MKLAPITPSSMGLSVQCSHCLKLKLTPQVYAVVDAAPFTYICEDCLSAPEIDTPYRYLVNNAKG